MAAFVRLTPDRPALAPGARVLAPGDYAAFVAAETVRAEAEARAEALVAEAEARAAEIRAAAEQVFEDEKARGYRTGMDAAQAEIADQMLTIVARSVDYLAKAEGEVAGAVMMCLRKILGDMPEGDVVIAAARNALAIVRNEPRVTVSVRPEVADEVRGRIGEILRDFGEIGFLEINADPTLEAGGCRLETEVGVVDASVEVQVAAIDKVIREKLTGR